MNEFEKLLACHKQLVNGEFSRVAAYLTHRGITHDDDKLLVEDIKRSYDLHFSDLKKIKFGTDEYYQFEKEYLSEAQALHAENRHHYYNQLNNINDVNLIDLLEVIIDIRQSQIQYNSFDKEKLIASLQKCGALDHTLEELVANTIIKLDKLENSL